jgi:hypothetical protein
MATLNHKGKDCSKTWGTSAQIMNEYLVPGIHCFFVACMDAAAGHWQER